MVRDALVIPKCAVVSALVIFEPCVRLHIFFASFTSGKYDDVSFHSSFVRALRVQLLGATVAVLFVALLLSIVIVSSSKNKN